MLFNVCEWKMLPDAFVDMLNISHTKKNTVFHGVFLSLGKNRDLHSVGQ
jgi:hypothetical protein